MPEGEEWHVCPACLEELKQQDALEIARDRQEQKSRQIGYGCLLALMVAASLITAFLWITHRMPIIR
jgi:hypothetical protein